MKTERKYELFLEDILQSINRILEYTKDLKFNTFKSNQLIIDAVVRNFEIIGEAVNKIPVEIKNKYQSIPWKQMNGMRNLIIHEYFGIDLDMIWEIASNKLPQNKNDFENLIENELIQKKLKL